MATREEVLAAFANNPRAELNPNEEAINYWMNTGIGNFNSVVDQVRAENPALAASIDAARGNTTGALNQVTSPVTNTATTGALNQATGTPATTGTTGALNLANNTAAVRGGDADYSAPVNLQTAANTSGLGVTGIGTSNTANAIVADANQSGNSWDYNNYLSSLKTGSSDVNQLKSLLNPLRAQNATLANNAENIFNEMIAQQKFTGDAWGSGTLGSKEAAALDYARRMAEAGLTSLRDIKQEAIPDDGEGGYRSRLINAKTGEVIGYDGAFTYGSDGQANRLGFAVNVTDDGTVIPYTIQQQSGWVKFREGTLKPVISLFGSFVPGMAPYIAAGNAINAANKGDWGTAVVSALGAAPGFSGALNLSAETLSTLNTAKTAAQVLNAIDKGNPVALANALMQTDAGKTILNSDMGNGITMGDVVNTAKIAKLASDGNYAEALATVGQLTNSPNLAVAASAVNLGEAIRSGDSFRVLNAMGQLDGAVKTADTTTKTDNTTNVAADAFVDAKRVGASDADALAASNALTQIAEANETFDGSGFATQNEAMNAAIAEGLDKFTFGGKSFTIDNSAAQIADLENTVRAETAARAASDSEWGDLTGAVTAATARNTVVIGNAEADNPDEALYLARARDPSATNFTFDGKTYTISATQAQMADANRTAALAEIKDLPNFNDAYAQARSLLGPNKTFEWNGKQYSTATAAERPDLSVTSIDALNTRNLATVTDASNTVAAQTDMAARDAAAIETANQISRAAATKPIESTGFFTQLYRDLNERFKLQGEAANEYLRNNPNSPITASVSSAFEAAGELSRNIGGAALAFDNKPLADAIIKGGTRLQEMGQSIGDGPEDTKNWNDTLSLIDKATGTEKLAVLAGRIMDGKSGLARQVGLELRQEIPALFLGGGLLRPTMIASGLIDTADTGGAAVIDAYDDVIKKGGTHQEGLVAGRRAGAAAAATEAAIQLTLGKIADVAAGKLDNVISNATAKVTGEGIVEGSQEAGASAAVDLALGNAVNVNKALTQGVVGAAVGKGTAASTTPIDAAQTTSTANEVTANTVTPISTATDLGPIGATVPGDTVVQNTDLGIIGNVTPSNDSVAIQTPVSVEDAQQAMADLGLNVSDEVAVSLATKIQNTVDSTSAVDSSLSSATNIGNTITTQIKSGSDASVAIGDTVTTAITSGGDTTSVINSAITSATKAGTGISAAVESTVTAAVKAGADTVSVINSAVTSAVNTGGNATTAVDSAVTAAVNSGGNVTAAIDSAVTAAVDTGANVDTSIAAAVTAAVNTGTNVSTVIDAATKAATTTGNNVNIVSDANTVTISNTTTNTQTTVDTKTGITTSVDNNTNMTTVVDGNTTTVVDNNSNTTTQTTVDTNNNTQTTVTADTNNNTNTQTVVDTKTDTTTSTTVNSNTNTTTQTTIDTNTQTTVVTDTNTNTQTTVKINTKTGETIDITTTDVPPDWKPPVIDTPVVPDLTSVPSTSTPSTPGKPTTPKLDDLRMGDDVAISGGLGPPTGIDIYGNPLGSRVTQGRIDPLARVKEAQAELERDLMMNQLDPRFANVIQQRIDPQQQTKQFESDIGALSKLLRGESSAPDAPKAPANEGKYYSYGAEDSIDDILGGRAANYKAGGYVEPLKASGGSMALPLLVKSGGALDKYSGRENFKEGKHVAGEGDGQSDDIPAWLADGEFVFPADVVSALGNGSTKAGTDKLYEMMHNIRERARSNGPKDLPPPAFKSPLDYLKSSKRSK